MHKRGYPQFAVLMSMSGRSNIFCRFNVTRLRLLLYKQDELVQLEEKLKEIDDKDPKDLFRGNRRRDQNPDRKAVLAQLEQALISYGTYKARNLPSNNRIYRSRSTPRGTPADSQPSGREGR